MILNKLKEFFDNKKILLLGYGLEGKSTLRLLKNLNCDKFVTVTDANKVDCDNALFIYGDRYLDEINGDYDIIMKSPGIALFDKPSEAVKAKITSQTDLFLRFCENPVIGVTGTKGKSTTASLIQHIFHVRNEKSLLIGNIGVPPLDVACDLQHDSHHKTVIVFELSCHQLEYVKASPHIAVLLNIFEEHLDHYIDFEHYKAAKENIFAFQKEGDILIRGEDVHASELGINPVMAKIRGKHNMRNIAVAVRTVSHLGINILDAINAAYSFTGLPHRLELFAETPVKWVNDSISTIPASAIAAVKAYPETDTLIIGGMDRGIDYSALVEFLQSKPKINVIALPDSGHIIAPQLSNVYKAADLADAVNHAKAITQKCCVLSPAAASYGFFKNFEERGERFKSLVMSDDRNGVTRGSGGYAWYAGLRGNAGNGGTQAFEKA